MEYLELCSQILDIDPKVRMVSVYDNWSKKLAGKTRSDVNIKLPEKITQDAVTQAILRWESRKKMKQWIGKAKYAMSEYEKIVRYTFYLNENKLLLVTTEPDIDHNMITDKIFKLL